MRDPAVPAALVGKAAVRNLLEDTWTAFPDLELKVVAGPYLALDGFGLGVAGCAAVPGVVVRATDPVAASFWPSASFRQRTRR